MKKEEAREKIIEEWYRWRDAKHPGKKQANGRDGLEFFTFLTNEKSHLLSFKISGDKWQVVHGWLSRANLVDD